MKLKETQNLFVLGLFLGAVGLISAVVLTLFSQKVAEPIEAARLRTLNSALLQVLPVFDNQPSRNVVEYDGVRFMGAAEKGKLIAVAAEASSPGYAGPITALIGFDPDGKILAVLITAQGETPGLGANVCERKFSKTIFNFFQPTPEGLPPNWFLDQFDGKTAAKNSGWKVKKDGGDIDYVTGATVTSRAITKLVSDASSVFAANRTELLAKLAPAEGGTEK